MQKIHEQNMCEHLSENESYRIPSEQTSPKNHIPLSTTVPSKLLDVQFYFLFFLLLILLTSLPLEPDGIGDHKQLIITNQRSKCLYIAVDKPKERFVSPACSKIQMIS